MFKVYHLIFKKEYELNSETAIRKYRVFKQNLKAIKEHNAKKLSWWHAVNEYSDLTDEEFNNHFNIKPHNPDEIKNFLNSKGKFLGYENIQNKPLKSAPTGDVNWLYSLTAVRNQGSCGSCWAFATVNAVESAYGIKYGQVTEHLSPQQLVDCNRAAYGCGGGWPIDAIAYVHQAGGLMSERNYPYEAYQGQCRFNSNSITVRMSTYEYCTDCEKDYWRSLLSRGSLSVLVTSQEILRSYGGGVINLQNNYCNNSDHVVLAYAWSTQNGWEIISLRNQWGANWGDNGNFHVYYTPYAQSTCWITKQGFLPIL